MKNHTDVDERIELFFQVLSGEPASSPACSERRHRYPEARSLDVGDRSCYRTASVKNVYRPLPRKFYEPSALIVAPELLGHWLVRNTPDGPVGGPIVETEAYVAGDDACHAAPGLTPRNRVMFGPPGYAYVYFIYGCHYCVNAVCQPAGLAEAVLIRAVEAQFGLSFLHQQRQVHEPRALTNGPGKLCEAMQIDRKLNGADLCDPCSALFIAENRKVQSFRDQLGPMVTTIRIGITRAAELPLRFYLEGSAFVSGRKSITPRRRHST